MRFEIRKKRVPLWWIIIGVFILSLIITLFFGISAPLEGYVNTNEEEIIDNGAIENKLDEVFEVYKHEETGVSLEIPKNWKKIVKNGGKSFVHAESGTTIWVKTLEYNPEINHKNIESILVNYLSETNNIEIISANDIDNTSIQIIYIKKENDIIYDHIVNFIWDREKIVMVDSLLNDKYYKSFEDTINYVHSSILLESQSKIGKDSVIYYNGYGKYELVVPKNLKYGESESTLLLADESKNMIISIQAIQTDESLESFDKLDYTKYASSTRTNFIISSYAAGKDYIYAEGTFQDKSTGTSMCLIQELITTGEYEYIITCEIPYGNIQEMYQEISSLFGSFKYYK